MPAIVTEYSGENNLKSNIYLTSLMWAAACAAIHAAPAVAQIYPVKPVRMIIPFSAGGAADVPGRIVMQQLSAVLKQQVIVENRSGAGSTIGADIAAKSAPDGYTIFMISNTHFVSAALHKKLPYDSLNDFTPVTQITSAPNVLVVHPSLPVKSVKDLIALAKARPGQIDYASSGNGSTQHLTGALFASMAGIRLTHIPYRGSGPVTADLLGGQVMVAFPGIAGMLAHIKSGKLRPLGVTGAKRSPELPNVPTIAEAGVKGYEMVAWFGVAGPKGLPREIQMKLHADLLRVLKAPEMGGSLQAVGQEPAWQDTPEKFFDFMKVEATKWAKVVKASGAEIN
ncbi:MAG: tripartite tricarboxylate transporter substrate binding protein [Burkholderiales bacterium]|jgi:tripartite-type tricarboxylate transporter receptor subunit TctC|nr:tripartite tricarboxylate transporter substrate binding protein [Burkholderiales bacterium]